MVAYQVPSELSGVGRILKLLSPIRRSPGGEVLYLHVEHLLNDVAAHYERVEAGYAALLQLLLTVVTRHLPADDAERARVLLQLIEPPLSASELESLHRTLEGLEWQTGILDDGFPSALLETLGSVLVGYVRGASTTPAASPSAVPSEGDSVPVETPQQVAPGAPVANGHALLDEVGEPEPATASQIRDSAVEQKPNGLHRRQVQTKTGDLQVMQARLHTDVQDTIRQNKESSNLLHSLLKDLNTATREGESEAVLQQMRRDVSLLAESHGNIASRLEKTYGSLKHIASDNERLSEELDRVRTLSLTDELTDLPNRRAFFRYLNAEIARVERDGSSFSLALIDLDNFKRINDAYGHSAGDEVLRTYASEILSVFRAHDLVARYGGEEFVVLLPNTDLSGAACALKKIQACARRTHVKLNGSSILVPTFSAGAAEYITSESADALIERADAALYEAKRLGRDRIEFVDGAAAHARALSMSPPRLREAEAENRQRFERK